MQTMLTQCFWHILLLHKESVVISQYLYTSRKKVKKVRPVLKHGRKIKFIFGPKGLVFSVALIFHVNQFFKHHTSRSLHMPPFSFSDTLDACISSSFVRVCPPGNAGPQSPGHFSLLSLFPIFS